MEEFGTPVDYPRLRRMLECDFLALTYLLKNVANVNQRCPNEERLLTLYFHWQLLSLAARRIFKIGETKAILKLTFVLDYIANVVGQRVHTTAFKNLLVADCLPNL